MGAAEEKRYREALEQIVDHKGFGEVEESLQKLFFEMNDLLLAFRSIAKVALEGDPNSEQVESFPDADESEPFPDEIPNCPVCGSKMVLRTGKYGKFYGCSNFPACRHTEQIKSFENESYEDEDEDHYESAGERLGRELDHAFYNR